MDKKDYKLAYEYILGVLELGGDMKWPLVIDSMNIFKELIEQNKPLTLKECIQKWEELGWTWSDDYKYRIKITKLNQEEQMYDNLYIRRNKSVIESDFQIPFDLIPLIYKTIRALEVDNDKEI